MTFIEFKGYYDDFEYWICENPKCCTDDDFIPDKEERGAYA